MDRSNYIGGSDAKRIIDGDWHTLYMEKLGFKAEEDLSHQFNVQLGIHTEQFHLNWLSKYEGFDIRPAPKQRARAGDPFMMARLDGWCLIKDTFVEVKHSRSSASRDSMLEWYQPQMAHYCNVTGRDHGYLSYIAGNTEPDYFKVQPSDDYLNALLDLERAFWWHVENKSPPDKLPESMLLRVQADARDVIVDDMRTVDMTYNNQWAVLCVDYQLNIGAAASFNKAKEGLKKLVDKDVRLAKGHGVTIKRNKAGSLLFSED